MKITESIWFASLGFPGTIGLVFGLDEATGKRKAYIGIGYGLNEWIDEIRIARTGAPFPAEIAERIAAWLTEKDVSGPSLKEGANHEQSR